jgi:hypothetical protein
MKLIRVKTAPYVKVKAHTQCHTHARTYTHTHTHTYTGQKQVEIEDHLDPAKPVKRHVRCCINHFVEDTRGINKPLCCKTAPARIGMCPHCKVESVRCKNNKSAAYICAITHLKLTDAQR